MIRLTISLAIALGVWLGYSSTANAYPSCNEYFCRCDTPCNTVCMSSTGWSTCLAVRCKTYHPQGCSNPLACAGATNQHKDSGPMCRPGEADDDAPAPAAKPAAKRAPKQRA